MRHTEPESAPEQPSRQSRPRTNRDNPYQFVTDDELTQEKIAARVREDQTREFIAKAKPSGKSASGIRGARSAHIPEEKRSEIKFQSNTAGRNEAWPKPRPREKKQSFWKKLFGR